jgi:polyisoprenoid-binding protein YceI
MKKLLLSTAIITFLYNVAIAQKYFTKNGNISFFSATSMENIKADNNQVMSVLDAQTGDLQFSVLIKSFHFKKALMEEHFNENYMESDKYQKATFKGMITEIGKVNFNKDGTFPVTVIGDLFMHGVTQKITTAGNITIAGGKITGTSVFKLTLSDYNISIPKVVQNNISKTIEITVNCLYDQKM